MGTCVSVFLNLAKSGHLRIPKSVILFENNQVLGFWTKNFRKDAFYYSANNFMAVWSLRGRSVPESTNLSVFE